MSLCTCRIFWPTAYAHAAYLDFFTILAHIGPMNPLLFFILAILSPFILAAVMLVPPYVGIAAASYIIYYKPDAVHPLAGKLGDVFYIIDVYSKLFSQWAYHLAETSILTYALPLLLLPILTIMLSIWLSGKVARKLRDVFQIGMLT
jgi:hypothetical protein